MRSENQTPIQVDHCYNTWPFRFRDFQRFPFLSSTLLTEHSQYRALYYLNTTRKIKCAKIACDGQTHYFSVEN